MDTKKKKLAQVDELVLKLGLTRDEVIDFFSKLPPVKEPKKSRPKIDITQVKVGMIWYEDDTFSFDILPKKIKAVVELVKGGIIYGDLTASELFGIPERPMSWFSAKQFFDKFSYPCKDNEKIVWYSIKQFENVYKTYEWVRKTFDIIHKQYRKKSYWSSTEYNSFVAWKQMFDSGYGLALDKYNCFYVRPILALEVF